MPSSRRFIDRLSPIEANNGLFFLHSDHLGSASLTTNASGAATARQLYDAWGNIRASASSGTMPTNIGYTGQREETGLGSLYDYGARMYSPVLGRFLSADTIVPDPNASQSFKRYSYVTNNPLRYSDVTGHCGGDENDPNNPDYDCWKKLREIEGAFPNISINPDWWKYSELDHLMSTLQDIYSLFDGNIDAFKSAFGSVRFNRGWYRVFGPKTPAEYNEFNGNITVYDAAFGSIDTFRAAVIHEMGHAFDFSSTYKESWFAPPKNVSFVKEDRWVSYCVLLRGRCLSGVLGTPASEYAKTNSAEDFAETFTAYGFNKFKNWIRPSDLGQPDQKRLDIIKHWIDLTVQSSTVQSGGN